MMGGSTLSCHQSPPFQSALTKATSTNPWWVGGSSYLRGRGRHSLRLPGLAPPWFWEPEVGQRWLGLWRRTERWPGPMYSPGPVGGGGNCLSHWRKKERNRSSLRPDNLKRTWDTHVRTVCSGGAVGLLLQLDLLQLLFLHQGQLLLMLLVLFGCESWERRAFVTNPETDLHHRINV